MAREVLVLNLPRGTDRVAYGRYSGRPPKYGNRKVLVDGMAFDSRREGKRWLELKMLEKGGEIFNLRRQVPFEILPTMRDKSGKVVERSVTYIADFVYDDKSGKQVVEDAKGMRTREYILKRKLMLFMLGIRIVEV